MAAAQHTSPVQPPQPLNECRQRGEVAEDRISIRIETDLCRCRADKEPAVIVPVACGLLSWLEECLKRGESLRVL